jgi:hypothetical protein
LVARVRDVDSVIERTVAIKAEYRPHCFDGAYFVEGSECIASSSGVEGKPAEAGEEPQRVVSCLAYSSPSEDGGDLFSQIFDWHLNAEDQ